MPSHRRWQFSLRTLLLLTVPVAVVLAVSRLTHAQELWWALGQSLVYFGGCGVLGGVLGHLTGRRDGAVDGALVGLLVASLILLGITLAGV